MSRKYECFDFFPIVGVEEIKKVPSEPGVYIGYNETKKSGEYRITYVGESGNLRQRIHQHPKGCTHFSFEEMLGRTEKQRRQREKQLIEKFRPENNIKHHQPKSLAIEWVVVKEDDCFKLVKQPDSLLKPEDPSYFEKEVVKRVKRRGS